MNKTAQGDVTIYTISNDPEVTFTLKGNGIKICDKYYSIWLFSDELNDVIEILQDIKKTTHKGE